MKIVYPMITIQKLIVFGRIMGEKIAIKKKLFLDYSYIIDFKNR